MNPSISSFAGHRGKSRGTSEDQLCILLMLCPFCNPQPRWESSRKRARILLQSSSPTPAGRRCCRHGQLAALRRDHAHRCSAPSSRRCRRLLLRSPVSPSHLYSIFSTQHLLCCCLHWNHLGRKWQLNPSIIFYTVCNVKSPLWIRNARSLPS